MPNNNPDESQEKSTLNQLKSWIQRFEKENTLAPYIYASISNVSLVGLQIYMKLVSAYINPLHALAIRAFFLFLLNTIVIHINSLVLDVKNPVTYRIVIIRMFWSSLTVSMFLAPLKYIPAGTANALFNLAPIIVCFVQAIRYKKSLNIKHFLLTTVSFVGVLLIVQPEFLFGQSNQSYSQYRYLLFFSLASAFTNSISMTYLHDLQGKIPGTIALHYFYIGQCFFNSIAMMFEEEDLKAKSLDAHFYIYVFGLVITAYFMQNFMTRAIMLKKPSFIMPLGYITIVLSTIMDYFLFGNSFSTLSIVGMLLTSSGLLVKLLIPEEDKTQKITKIEEQK